MNAHVLEDLHSAEQEKIFEITCTISGAKMGVGDYTVKVYFSIEKTDGRGTDVLVGI